MGGIIWHDTLMNDKTMVLCKTPFRAPVLISTYHSYLQSLRLESTRLTQLSNVNLKQSSRGRNRMFLLHRKTG